MPLLALPGGPLAKHRGAETDGTLTVTGRTVATTGTIYMDAELITIARQLMQERYVEGRHHIGSALRTRSGAVFTGVHVEAGNGRITLCGEAVAIGAAATAGDTDIVSIVAVTESGDVVPPCGMCRELISDYAPEALVIVQCEGQPVEVPVLELLPRKYRSADYPNRRKNA